MAGSYQARAKDCPKVRIIGGQERGRKLTAPRGQETRPLTARVRASIFSRLASRNAITGARVLDIFAGSGSFGLEALSRGASRVVFVDRARVAAMAIAYNVSQLRLAGFTRIVTAHFRRALGELAEAGECFDLIFVDAPFAADSTTEVLALIAVLGLLAPDGILVTRQFHRAPMPVGAGLKCVNIAKIGDHRIAFYRRLQNGAANEDTLTSRKGKDASPCTAGMSGKDTHGK
jgi:16S rRNA (guanine966-N2)-methyltransferase